MKILLKYSLFFLLFIGFTSVLFAQQQPVITKVSKFKPPVVKTYLGANQNGAQVTADEGSQLIGLPLKVVDDKNNQYTIDSYQFLYKQKSIVQDDETGKKEVAFTIASERFDSVPLPNIWVNNIRGRLQTDEQIYFFDILVKDKEGRKFFAPELKITIK